MIEHNSTRKRFLLGLMLSSAMFAVQPSVFSAESESSQETILFLGDSITVQGVYIRAIRGGTE